MKRLVPALGAAMVSALLMFYPCVSAFGCGGGGGGGGGDDSGGQPGFVAAEPIKVDVDIKDPPSVEEIAKIMGPQWAAHNIIDPKTGMTKYEKAVCDQWVLEGQMGQAHAESIRMDKGLSASKVAAKGASVAAGVVGILAAGTTMAIPVTVIGIGQDVLSTGAGVVADQMVNKGKSFKGAVKSAIGPAIAKGVVSTALTKVDTGSKVVDGVIGTVGGLSYDEAVSGAPNSAPPPDLSPIGPTSPSAIVPSSGIVGKSF